MANKSQINCQFILQSPGSEPNFYTITGCKDLYAPEVIDQAPPTLGRLMDRIWQSASNATLGENAWSMISPNYGGMVPLALAVPNPRKNILSRWARCTASILETGGDLARQRADFRGGEDASEFPVRAEAYGPMTILCNTPYLAYGSEGLWQTLASMMPTRPDYGAFCSAVTSKCPSTAAIISFMLMVRIVFTRAMARLCSLVTVSQSKDHIKIQLQPLTSIDLVSWVGASSEKQALDIYGALFRILIQNIDVFLGIGTGSSVWKSILGVNALNYATYSSHPLYQANKIIKAGGTVELCFETQEQASTTTTRSAEDSFAMGGVNDPGGYEPAGPLTDEDEQDPSPTTEPMYTPQEQADPDHGIRTKPGDLAEGSPLASDNVEEVLVEGDVIGTFAAVSYADDTVIERASTFNEVDIDSFSAPQLISLAGYYAYLYDKFSYPSAWSADFDTAFSGENFKGFIDDYLTSGGKFGLYVSPIVPNVTKLLASLNQAVRKAQSKCDPTQLRLIADGRTNEWYTQVIESFTEEELPSYLTPLNMVVLSELPSEFDPYIIDGPNHLEMADDQLCYLYSTVADFTPFTESIHGADSLGYVAGDIVVKHSGPVALPRSLNAAACQHTMLGGLLVGGRSISCKPEAALARLAATRLRDLKEVSADVKPGGVRGSAVISPAKRKSVLVPVLTGAIGGGATAITDIVAFKKEADKGK